MSATTDIAETPAVAKAQRAKTFDDFLSQKVEAASALAETALEQASGHPALETIVATWAAAALATAELDAKHSALEEVGGDGDAFDLANEAWLDSDAKAHEIARGLLSVPAGSSGMALAKIKTFLATQGALPEQELDQNGDHMLAMKSLVRDLEAGFAAAEPQSPLHPDTELVQLGAELEVRWAAEVALDGSEHGDEEFEAAVERTGEIAHRIHAIEPTTMEGFRVSARAVAWHADAYDQTATRNYDATSSFSFQAARLVDALTAGTAKNGLAQGMMEGWGELIASFQAVRSSWSAANEAETRAQAAFEIHVECLRPQVMKDAKVYFETGLDQNDRLTLAQKCDLLPHVRAWKEIRDKAWKDFDCEALVDAVNDLDTERTELEERILKQPAVGLGSIVAKLAVTLYRMSSLDPEDPVDLRRLLGEADHGELAGVFLEALRLADPGHPAAAVKAFDPAAWIADFEAYPGHKITVRGPEYEDPIAWGPDMPAYEGILITDPEAIARFDARMRSNYTDAQWAKELARPGRYDRAGRAIVVDDQQRIDYAYPDGGPEADRLMALLALRRDLYFSRRSPLGAHLWRALEAWGREAVRDHVKANPAQFPEGLNWAAADWIEAFEAAGGRIDLDDVGDVFAGSPYPTPSAQARLWKVLVDSGLEHAVAATVRAEREIAQ